MVRRGVKGTNVTSSEAQMANGRSMYSWIRMSALAVLMFLFVVRAASVAWEEARRLFSFLFSFSLPTAVDWLADGAQLWIGLSVFILSLEERERKNLKKKVNEMTGDTTCCSRRKDNERESALIADALRKRSMQ